MATDPLMTPFELNGLRLRNRIVSTAHSVRYIDKGMPDERYRLYHEERAKGGVGLIICGASASIHPDSPVLWGQIDLSTDEVIPYLKRLSAAVKRHGAAMLCQMTHQGRRTYGFAGDWLPMLAPSIIREPHHRGFPKAMEDYDIARVIDGFASAAVRCEEGGFDGIEVQAFGHLLGQFLSPLANVRSDDYGGSVFNRARLLLEVIAEIRRRVSRSFVVAVRMTGDEVEAGGMTAEESALVVEALQQAGGVDLINVNGGHPFTEFGLAEWVPSMNLPAAQYLPTAAALKARTTLPILHAGALGDPATARHAILEGLVDLVGMTRANLADPYLVQKLHSGEEQRVRPCVGLGLCIDRVFAGLDVVCGHNAATGREAFIPHNVKPSDGPKRQVLVVGGGPGGLEAARVAALRGHSVTLVEATNRLGGQLVLAAVPRPRRQIQGVADWLIAEVERLGVEIRFDCLADADFVMNAGADAVIIATGGVPTEGSFAGAELARSVWDCLGGGLALSGDYLLFDDHGDHQAASCAQYMAERGARVTIVTADRAPMLELGATTAPVYQRDFYNLGVKTITDHKVIGLEKAGNRLRATLENILSKQAAVLEVDGVVADLGTTPVEELYFELKPQSRNLGEVDLLKFARGLPCAVQRNDTGKFDLFRIGDAVASRTLHSAMFDAMRVSLGL